MIEVAIFGAISFVLDQIAIKLWFQGGSISLVMLPIVLMAFRRGLAAGLLTGLLSGLIQVISATGSIYHPVQGFLDYFVAFTLVGLAAIVRVQLLQAREENSKGKMVSAIILGTVIGGLFRYLIHFVGGIYFFGSFAPEGQPAWLYSLLYNGGYMIPSIILTAIIAIILFTSAPRLLKHS